MVNIAAQRRNDAGLHADSGVTRAEDLAAKQAWKIGDQFDVGYWLRRHGLDLQAIELIQQRPAAQDLLSGNVDCATAMSYNEFQTILKAGKLKTDLFSVRFAQEGSGFLEDGLYVRAEDLNDARKRDQLVTLLQCLAVDGDTPLAIRLKQSPSLSVTWMATRHQAMLKEILQLMDLDQGFGLLDPDFRPHCRNRRRQR